MSLSANSVFPQIYDATIHNTGLYGHASALDRCDLTRSGRHAIFSELESGEENIPRQPRRPYSVVSEVSGQRYADNAFLQLDGPVANVLKEFDSL